MLIPSTVFLSTPFLRLPFDREGVLPRRHETSDSGRMSLYFRRVRTQNMVYMVSLRTSVERNLSSTIYRYRTDVICSLRLQNEFVKTIWVCVKLPGLSDVKTPIEKKMYFVCILRSPWSTLLNLHF